MPIGPCIVHVAYTRRALRLGDALDVVQKCISRRSTFHEFVVGPLTGTLDWSTVSSLGPRGLVPCPLGMGRSRASKSMVGPILLETLPLDAHLPVSPGICFKLEFESSLAARGHVAPRACTIRSLCVYLRSSAVVVPGSLSVLLPPPLQSSRPVG